MTTTAENLPADVLEDLIALYAAGEASPGTRQLVEAYAGTRPEVAARLHAPLAVSAPRPPAPPDVCLKSLNRAKRWQLLRMFCLGWGLVTLLVPLHPYFWPQKTFVAVAEGTSSMAWGLFVYYSERLRKAALR